MAGNIYICAGFPYPHEVSWLQTSLMGFYVIDQNTKQHMVVFLKQQQKKYGMCLYLASPLNFYTAFHV